MRGIVELHPRESFSFFVWKETMTWAIFSNMNNILEIVIWDKVLIYVLWISAIALVQVGFFYILQNNVPKKCWLANGFQIPTFHWIYGAIDWKVHHHFTPHLERENVAN